MSIEYPCVHWNDGKCKKFSDDKVRSWCVEGPCEYATPSNADRIRAMSDEELAQQMSKSVYICARYDFDIEVKRKCDSNCYACILEWLKRPAEEE